MPKSVATPKVIRKADIFFRRVNGSVRHLPPVIENSSDALHASLNHRGVVNLPYMAELLGKDEINVLDELAQPDQPQLFYDPQEQRWTVRSEYLSGDTRAKLKIIQRLEQENPETYAAMRLYNNTAALPTHLSKYLLPPANPEIRGKVAQHLGGEAWCELEGSISIAGGLGSPWIPASAVRDFAAHLLSCEPSKIRADYAAVLALWRIETQYSSIEIQAGKSEYAVSYQRKKSHELITRDLFWVLNHALNGTQPEVEIRDTIFVPGEGYKDVKNREETRAATELAQIKLTQVKEMFKEWLWSDFDRALHLTEIYNAGFPRPVRREFDGSYLKLIGSNPEIKPYPHQLNAVDRAIQSPNTLFLHEVGTGKTLCMIIAAMECRRMGLARKPVIACLKSTIPQIVASFRQLYPTSKLLVADEDSFKKENRRNLFWRVQSGDWDCVIVSHEQLFAIPISWEIRIAYIQSELEKVRSYSEAGSNEDGDRLLAKELANAMTTLENDLEYMEVMRQVEDAARRGEGALARAILQEAAGSDVIQFDKKGKISKGRRRNEQKAQDDASKRISEHVNRAVESHRKDGCIPKWEDLGIDFLAVDECHIAKNLKRATKLRNIAGLPNPDTQRSIDLLLKLQNIQSKGGKVIFATGTYPTNSIAEIWALQRYLGYEALRDTFRMDHFDNWAMQFGSLRTDIEITSTGGLKKKTRFAEFNNMPELMDLVGQFTDFVTADSAGIKRPELITRAVTAPTSIDQLSILDEILERNEALNRNDACQYHNADGALIEDNHLTLTGMGSLNSIDPRLIRSNARNHPRSKLNLAALNIYQIWKSTGVAKLAQLVFSDLSTPRDDDRLTAYRYVKDLLILLGIPSREIAIIHDYKPGQLKTLFQDVNKGKIRILIGSTTKCGTGVNVQDRAIALHDISLPWTPALMKQRTGRVQRQGNKCSRTWEFIYVTEGRNSAPGFDAFKAQCLQTKAAFHHQFMSGQFESRDFQDIGEDAANYQITKALASGNPEILEYFRLEDQIRKVELEYNSLVTQITRDQATFQDLPNQKLAINRRLEGLNRDRVSADAIPHPKSDGFEIILNGVEYTDLAEASEDLKATLNRIVRNRVMQTRYPIGQYGDFRICLDYYGGEHIRNIYLKGKASEYPAQSLGLISLHNALDQIDEAIVRGQESLETCFTNESTIPARIDSLRAKLDGIAPQLQSLRQRHAELRKSLAIDQADDQVEERETSIETEEGETPKTVAQPIKMPKLEGESLKANVQSLQKSGKLMNNCTSAIYRGIEPSVINYLKSLPDLTSKDAEGKPTTWMDEIRAEALRVSRLLETGSVISIPVDRPHADLHVLPGGKMRQLQSATNR